MRQISFSATFDWDNSGNFSFDETNYVESLSGDESMSPPGEFSFSGSGFISEISIVLINTSSRFSTTNSSSPIYSYIASGAFLQKRVNVNITINGVTYTIFRGYIKSMNEVYRDNKSIGKVTVKCRSQDDIIKNMQVSTTASISKLAVISQYDEGELLKRTLEASGLVDNVHFRSQAYANPTIDRGLFTIPYYWLEKESPIEDAWLLASACAGRFFYNAQDGLFYYKNAFEYGVGEGGTSQETITESNCENIQYNDSDSDLIENVSVTARTRYVTENMEIWRADKPVKVAPNSTISVDCEVGKPIIEANSTSYVATSAAGMLINSGISVSFGTIYSQKIKLNVTNSTNRLVFLRNLSVMGKQLEPLDNIEYANSSSSTFWSTRNGSEKTISSNPYIQTYAQAKAIGDISLDRQSAFTTTISIKRYLGTKFLKIGQRVTVNVSGKVNADFIITKIKYTLNNNGFSQDLDLTGATGIYGLAIGDYFIIGTHSQNSNKKLFY